MFSKYCLLLAILAALDAHQAYGQSPPLRTPPQAYGGPPVYDLFRAQTGMLRPLLRTPPQAYGGPPVYDLFRAQTGILPNYYQFYLPRQQLQRTLQVQDYQLQHQGTAIRAMQNQRQQGQTPEPMVQPTGSRSVYMNYSHFYPGLTGKPVQPTLR